MMRYYDNKYRHKRYKRNNSDRCHNCDKIGHDSRSCPDPITSWGIILVKLDGLDITDITHSPTKIECIDEVKLISDTDTYDAAMLMEKIQFLLVSRKHSLGYIEFMMGRYSLKSIEHLSFIIQQMLPSEIEKIKKHIDDFDYLWENLWGDNFKHNNDYYTSKKLFEKLNDPKQVDIKLDYLLDKIETPTVYRTPEFGFPKGRKNRGESEKQCAVREFCEEAGFTEDDIRIIDEVEPIVENLTGTNGVSYRHIYYLAEFVSDKEVSLTGNVNQKYEIGSVGFYTYDDAQHLIRPYHVDKKNIVTKLFFYYLSKLMKNADVKNHLRNKRDRLKKIKNKTKSKVDTTTEIEVKKVK